ncbi:hypothetical protein K440DRAFT_150377 [Wilcoxina mikolae CBS 423.85]|nr:hypothetical protein K440DRAFT_150377 [Wilcoxina mikolae CBS 423.85]
MSTTIPTTETADTTTTTPDAASVLISTFELFDLAPPPTTTQLTLTADFPLESYESLLTSFSLPQSLPDSITALTLELFTYGFPPGFLTSLISLLPNLTRLTLHLQLIAGTTAESFGDAAEFLKTALANGLQELEMVDVFVPPDFFPAVVSEREAAWNLKVLKLLYTFRSADREFNARLPVGSIPCLLVPRLETIKIRIQPEAEDKPGMTPCPAAAAEGCYQGEGAGFECVFVGT